MYFGLIGFGLLVGLFGFLIGLVIQILFLLNLMRLLEAVQPQNRALSPGLVWLNLIPVFSLGWMIYTVLKIKDSVQRENASRWGGPVNEGNTHTIGLAYAIIAAATFVFSLGGRESRGLSVFAALISVAVVVLWIMYWVKTNRLRRDLERTAGRGYGPSAAYGPGGQSYGPGYGPAYPPAYGPGPTGQAGAPPPAPQPPAWTPAPSEDQAAPPQASPPNRNCVQCGKELDPNDEFCSTCGMPAPKR